MAALAVIQIFKLTTVTRSAPRRDVVSTVGSFTPGIYWVI
jgi:hypothetical protein